MAVRYTFAVGTAAEWAASPLILALGQPGWDRTNLRMKIGDGASLWSALPIYAPGSSADLSGYATLASPTLTGDPKAPTPSTPDNDTSIATTAFVRAAISTYAPGGGGGAVTSVAARTGDVVLTTADIGGLTALLLTAQTTLAGINTQTGNYTLVLGDAGDLIQANSASALAFTVPQNSSVAFPVGTVINFANVNTGALTITPGTGTTINSPAGFRITTQYAQASLVKTATNTWLLSGNTVV